MIGSKKNKKHRIIDVNKYNNIKKNGYSKFDASNPYTFFGGIVIYAVVVFFIIIGIPWQGVKVEPIPPDALPVAVPVFIFLYIVVYGLLYFFDKHRKIKKQLRKL